MIIKKFVGKTEEEALEAARKELGSGVVIMNVKAVERKGLAALFRAKQTEVTVALEEENDTVVPVRRDRAARPAEKNSGESITQTEENPGGSVLMKEDRIAIEKRLDSLQSLLMNRFQQSEEERQKVPGTGEFSGDEGAAEEEKPEEPGQESDGVKTGDTANVTPYLLVLLIAIVLLAVIVVLRVRKGKKK